MSSSVLRLQCFAALQITSGSNLTICKIMVSEPAASAFNRISRYKITVTSLPEGFVNTCPRTLLVEGFQT